MTSGVPSAPSRMSAAMMAPADSLYCGGAATLILQAVPVNFADYRNSTASSGTMFLQGWRAEPPTVKAQNLLMAEGIGIEANTTACTLARARPADSA